MHCMLTREKNNGRTKLLSVAAAAAVTVGRAVGSVLDRHKTAPHKFSYWK